MNLELSGQIFAKYSNVKFRENPSVGAELFHADRWTDIAKLILASRNFANAPENLKYDDMQ